MKRYSQIVDVTPKLADQWLRKNTNNRKLRQGLIDTYAHTMKNGQWLLTAEPVIFSAPYRDRDSMKYKSETLMDGQHRLHAVIKSGCSVPMTVWWNCDSEEFSVIGNGRRRTAGDVLSLVHTELKDPFVTASVASGFVRYTLSYNRPVEPWIVRNILEAYPTDMQAGARYKHKLGRFANQPAIAAFVFGRLIMARVTDELVDQITSGIGFKENDAARRLAMYFQDQALRLDGKDSPETIFYKVCNGVAAALQRKECHYISDNLAGLEYLRNQAKDRLAEGVKIIHGKNEPANFYTPKQSPRRSKLAARAKDKKE